ncbi:exocyst complex component 4 [Tetranychus urticae]|nr:exocyst complex component 4 [Tetranychus urticae]
MMSDNQPKRPPRMARSMSKESSTGLLMSVIRSLTASRDVDERDREKANLERDFGESDARLDQLIVNHHSDLTAVMNAFSKVSTQLKDAKERCKSMKENLITCKDLLRCKKDELRKLWRESLENRHVLELLNEVENVTRVPETVTDLVEKRKYLQASQLLVDSISSLESNLQHVEALKEVKSDLIARKDQIYNMLIDELHKHVYARSTAHLVKKFKRTASERRKDGNLPSRKVSIADILSPALYQSNLSIRRRPNLSSQTDITDETTNQEGQSDNQTDIENDSKNFISLIIDCLCLLGKIPDTVEVIKDRTEKELVNLVKRTARELIGGINHQNSNANITFNNGPITVCLRCSLILKDETHRSYLLQELFELLFQQFRVVVTLHENILLPCLKNAIVQCDLQNSSIVFYNSADLWTKIQSVLQMVADLYLDISGTNAIEKSIAAASQDSKMLTHSSTSLADLNSYFVRKRPALSVTVGNSFHKIKKTPLFKFDSSSHAMSLNAYFQEQKEAMKAERSGGNAMDSIDLSLSETEQYLVCEPAAENIVVFFNPLMRFIFDIDDELNLEEDNHCPLYSYLISCVKLFFNQIKIDLDRILDTSNKSLDAWRIVNDPDMMNKLNQSRPILQSALIIDKASQDLKNLIFALPMYADEFLTFICNLLSSFKESCSSAYRGIVQPESEDKRIISATWAKDEDISRFLKDLPNWPGAQKPYREVRGRNLAAIGSSMTFDESPEVIRLRNKKESEILASNLTQDTLIPSHEILSDVSQLKSLGQLQESLEWLASHIFSLATSLSKSQNDSNLLKAQLMPSGQSSQQKHQIDVVNLADVSIAALNQIGREFEELSETCLLVLHLEVRVHCFYYLLRVTKGNFAPGIDAQEPDVEVVQLNKDLSSVDEALSLSLQQWKLKYVFEGVSHLVATILINSASSIDRINHNGVKKMCRNIFAIQQNLTSITMSREVALDYARQYFELFYSSPEEILALIEERGPQFQAQEYVSAIELLHRSSPGRDPNKLKANKQRLAEILDEAAVSV